MSLRRFPLGPTLCHRPSQTIEGAAPLGGAAPVSPDRLKAFQSENQATPAGNPKVYKSPNLLCEME